MFKKDMSWFQSGRLRIRGIEESGMLDCVENIKVGEGTDDSKKYDCFDRSVGCVEGERAKESPHWSCRERANSSR